MQKPAPSPLPALLRSVGVAVLRIGTGCLVTFEHAWPQVLAGAAHVWKKQPWPLIDTVAGAGFPFPNVVAPAATLLTFAAAVALATGMLARVSAGVLIALAALAFRWAWNNGEAELFLVYILAFASIVFSGAGHFSLDALFSVRRKEKQVTAPTWKRG